MSIFRRKQNPVAKDEPSLLDIDDTPGTTAQDANLAPALSKKSSLLSWNKRQEGQSTAVEAPPSAQQYRSNQMLPSPLQPSSISPRISTSSRTSVFERSVDASVGLGATGAMHVSQPGLAGDVRIVNPSHAQLVVENQIPSVLDASVEAITSNEDLDRVEIVTAQPTSTNSESLLSVPTLVNPWSEEENIATAHVSSDVGGHGASKRLSFVSYADLLGVEQAEAEAASLHSTTISPKPLSPDPTGTGVGGTTANAPTTSPFRPGSTTLESTGRRSKSIVTIANGSATDLELTRATMADTIMQSSLAGEPDGNPWA